MYIYVNKKKHIIIRSLLIEATLFCPSPFRYNPKPETINLKPQTQMSKPETLDPNPQPLVYPNPVNTPTLPSSVTIHPKPQTLDPKL